MFVIIESMTLVIFVLFSDSECAKDDGENVLADFVQIRKSRIFVDKSAIISDVLSEEDEGGPFVKELTAPAGFGKSTIINMIKRFVAKQVNAKGEPVLLNTTENYKVFCRPPLEICKDRSFIEKHFGQYPVVHINYRRLRGVIDYESLLFEVREVLAETFAEHSYLEHIEGLWNNVDMISKDEFHRFINSGKVLTSDVIARAFYLLSYVLYTNFNKKVIVLIDDYDTYAQKILFRNIEDENKIIDFCSELNNRILKFNNPYLDRAVVTGVLRLYEVDKNIQDFMFRSNHKFSKYFGYTSREIETVLSRNIKNFTEVKEKKKNLELFYGGFTTRGQNISTVNFWSVSQFFKNKMKLRTYWTDLEYIKPFNKLICDDDISQVILKLIKGKKYDIYIEERFRKVDILSLSKVKNQEVENFEIYWFFLLLYSLGYLTIDESNVEKSSSLEYLKVPNVEIKIDLTREIKKCYKNRFGYKQSVVNGLIRSVDSFQPHKVNIETFQNFYKSLYNLLNNTYSYPETDNDVRNVLFVNLLDRFYNCKSEIRTVFKYNETVTGHGEIDLMVINSHEVVVVIETKVVQKAELKENELEDVAIAGYNRIEKEVHQYVLDNLPHISGRVYVGLSLHKNTGNITLAFTSFTESPGDFRNVTVINVNS